MKRITYYTQLRFVVEHIKTISTPHLLEEIYLCPQSGYIEFKAAELLDDMLFSKKLQKIQLFVHEKTATRIFPKLNEKGRVKMSVRSMISHGFHLLIC